MKTEDSSGIVGFLCFVLVCALLSLAVIGCGDANPMEPSFTKVQPVPTNGAR